MTPGEPRSIAWLFGEALKEPVGNRGAWLDAACPDPATRDEVWALLRVYDEAPGFLEAPIDAAAAVQIIDEREGRRAEGRRLGPYRLAREIEDESPQHQKPFKREQKVWGVAYVPGENPELEWRL